MLYEDLAALPPHQFKRACGVNRSTFAAMVDVLTPHLDRQGQRGGQNTLTVANQLLLTLQYWREYRTQFHIGLDFGVSEATVCRKFAKLEPWLMQSGRFRLPGKRRLLEPEIDFELVVVDVTEVSIERPKKQREYYYSGKEKRHTLKGQLVIDFHTEAFIVVATDKGRAHDWRLWGTSEESCLCLADKGYQGLAKQHEMSLIPHRKLPRQPLPQADKEANRAFAAKT